jgi:hypothetical protein
MAIRSPILALALSMAIAQNVVGMDISQKDAEEYLNNCSKGNSSSCKYAAEYYQMQSSKEKERARKILEPACAKSKPSYEECAALGMVSSDSLSSGLLTNRCKDDKKACFALAYAEKAGHRLKEANAIWIELCEKNLLESSCDAAEESVAVPGEVRDLFEVARECLHWRGEDPYDQERARDIERATQRTCQDRTARYADLERKYRDQPAVLFLLRRMKLMDNS